MKVLFITACLSMLSGWAATDDAASRWFRYPAISPDGQFIAFSRSGQTVYFGSSRIGIPQLGAKDRISGWFENSETAPDIQICNTPDDIAAGRDAQLNAAIDDLPKTLR